MKKRVIICVGIILIVIIAIIITLKMFNTKDIYTITYSATNANYKVYEEGKNYDVIKDKET